MTDTEKLALLITESGLKKSYLAKELGMTCQTFRRCATNRSDFKPAQINRLCELLGVKTLQEKESIFFANYGA